MPTRLVRLCATCVVASLLWGCAAPTVNLSEAETLYEHADYFQAYQSIQVARAQAPDDPAVERAYWKIRQGYLLHEAQRLVFLNREDEALERIEKVLALDPENRIALRWKGKALKKLALRAVDAGDDAVAAGDLQVGLQRYNEALAFEPGNAEAIAGLERLGEAWTRQQKSARGHYIDGVRALGDHAYRRTQYHLGIALEKDPTLTEAQEPAEVADRQVVEERYAKARQMEDRGLFGAALREYENLREVHPDLEGIDSRVERARAEFDADKLAIQGELAVYRGDFDGGRELLTKAFEMTTRQQESIGERLLIAHERELESQYLVAKDLELQRRLDEAIVALGKVEEAVPGYRDVRARIADLQLRIDEASKAYAAGVEAASAGNLDEAIDQLTDVQLYWQGYKDSRELLTRYREQRDLKRSDNG